MNQLPAIILAAGLSTRMKAFKPLLPLGNKPLIGHVIDSLRQSGAVGKIVVVIGHRREEIAAAVREMTQKGDQTAADIQIILNPDYATGEMLSSVRAGIAALGFDKKAENGTSPGFVLAFADQPAVKPETLRTLIHGFLATTQPPCDPTRSAQKGITVLTKPPLAIPTFLGKRGHPVVFSSALLPAIAFLSAGDTLRTVVHQHLSQALLIPVEDSSVLDDLDTPEDFARAEEKYRGI